MSFELYTKSFVPETAVAGYRAVKLGVAGGVVQASAPTDEIIGIANFLGADPANGDDTVDVIMIGLADVQYGANVTAGDNLTCDANGNAITATVEGSRLIGKALHSGGAGDIYEAFLSPSVLAVAGVA